MKAELHHAARTLGGEIVSGAISCPGPGHSPRDRSLRVYHDSQAPLGWRVHSLAGDDWRTCQDYVAQRLGLPDRRSAGKEQPASKPVQPVRAQEHRQRSCDANSLALSIFREGKLIDDDR